MNISTRIFLLLFVVILFSAAINFSLIRFQSKSLHENSEVLYSETITQSLSETLIRDVIDGNKIRVSSELRKFVSRDNPIDFLFIVDANHKIIAHSFINGFPKYLLNQQNNNLEHERISLINRYRSDEGLVNEYTSTLLKGLDFVLHIGINQSHFTSVLSRNNQIIITASASLLFISVLLAYFWTRKIINPLRRLTDFIEQYGSGKQVEIEVEKSTPNEIKNLNTILKQAVEKRSEAERELAHHANYDALTHLPNRYLTVDRLNQLIHEAQRNHQYVAIMFIDLDDFKKINDSLGHELGDEILVNVAARLKSNVRAGDTIGRLGGDEFIGLFGDLKSIIDAKPLAENILSKFKEPFRFEDRVFSVSASIGVAFFPDDGESASDLLKKADTAMYHSKKMGKNVYSFHSDEMFSAVKRRMELEENMLTALQNSEFQLVFQPKYLVNSRQVHGCEALLRWKSQVLGDVSPVEFIPVAEQSGLIVQIGKYVIQTAIEFTAELNNNTSSKLSVAVNLSPAQFRDTKLVSFIIGTLEKYNFKADLFEVEITENVLISEESTVSKTLEEMVDVGIKISMDDFGTGYSSLSYLRRFPFDAIKIDRSFVQDISISDQDQELVDATIAMAHALDLTVVAEGVETKEQLEFLIKKGCDIAQGYYFSKPLPQDKFLELFESKGQIENY